MVPLGPPVNTVVFVLVILGAALMFARQTRLRR
jgi:hypothetical protein